MADVNKKAIFVNTASQIIVRVVTLAFTLNSVKLLAQYLGAAGVGDFNAVTTYVNFFLVIADLGLFSVTVREISKAPDHEKKIMSNVLTIRAVSAFIVSLVAIALIAFTPYRSNHNIIFGVIIATGFLYFNLLGSVYDMVLQNRLKMQFSALAELLSKLVTIAALYTITILHGSFLWVVGTVALSGIMIWLFKWYFARRFISFGPKYNKEVSSWIFNLSWPIGIVFIVNNLYFKLDTLMLYPMKGREAVGIYSNAYKILEVIAFFGSYFASSLKPAISEHIGKNKEMVASLVQKSFNVMLFISLPMTVICSVFSKEIITLLSTREFIPGSSALILLAFTLPLIYLNTLLAEILIANDEKKLMIKIAVSVLLFNFVFNLFAIPKYSFMGAAWGTLISEVVLLAINWFNAHRVVSFKIDWATTLKILLVFAITLVATLFIRQLPIHFIIGIALSAIAYLLLSQLFKVYDLKSFRELIKPTGNHNG
jgi:O-antigen/teichoic acid export membrane protein